MGSCEDQGAGSFYDAGVSGDTLRSKRVLRRRASEKDAAGRSRDLRNAGQRPSLSAIPLCAPQQCDAESPRNCSCPHGNETRAMRFAPAPPLGSPTTSLLRSRFQAGFPTMKRRLLPMVRASGPDLGANLGSPLHLAYLPSAATPSNGGGWQLRPNQQGLPAGSGARPELPGDHFRARRSTPIHKHERGIYRLKQFLSSQPSGEKDGASAPLRAFDTLLSSAIISSCG